MSARFRARIAALEASGRPICGEAAMLSDDELWEVIRRAAAPGAAVPDLATASEGEVDRFLMDAAEPGK